MSKCFRTILFRVRHTKFKKYAKIIFRHIEPCKINFFYDKLTYKRYAWKTTYQRRCTLPLFPSSSIQLKIVGSSDVRTTNPRTLRGFSLFSCWTWNVQFCSLQWSLMNEPWAMAMRNEEKEARGELAKRPVEALRTTDGVRAVRLAAESVPFTPTLTNSPH